MAAELVPYCRWPEHFDRDGNDLEPTCATCMWRSICYWLAVTGVYVTAPMDRT